MQAEQRGFAQVKFDPQQRSGILTHPYLLSAFAYHNNTSPIHRGVFLTRNIVGRRLKPPPVAVAFKDDEFDPTLTMREKSHPAHQRHRLHVVPLGHQPARLQPRELRRRRPLAHQPTTRKNVDTRATTRPSRARRSRSRRARDIADHAATSPAAHRAFITALFHHAVKQPTAAYGTDTLENLRESFLSSGFHIRELLANIATTTALQPNDQPIAR